MQQNILQQSKKSLLNNSLSRIPQRSYKRLPGQRERRFYNVDNPNYSRVCIIGGGISGLQAAYQISRYSRFHGRELRLFNEQTHHYYSAHSSFIINGNRTLEEISRPLLSLIEASNLIEFNEVKKVIPEENHIVTQDNKYYEYDYLVMACGVQDNLRIIPNLEGILQNEENNSVHLISNQYQLENLQNNILEYIKPKKILVYSSGYYTKYYLNAYNIAQLLADKYQQNTHITLITKESSIFPIQQHDEFLKEKASKNQIKILENTTITKIDNQQQQVTLSSNNNQLMQETYDLLLIDPEQIVPKFTIDSGLASTRTNRYLDVNPRTLLHNKFNDILALGDCVEPPTFSSFYSTFCQSCVLAKNLDSVVMQQFNSDSLTKFKGETQLTVYTGHGQLTEIILNEHYEYQIPKTPSKILFYKELLTKNYLYFNYWVQNRFLRTPMLKVPQHYLPTKYQKHNKNASDTL